MKKETWVWMPHAAHWLLGTRCRFHLATYVGGYVVSTVGECPKHGNGEDWRDTQKFETVGAGPQCYETMVFKAVPDEENGCCPWTPESGEDVDCVRYMTADEATNGHMEMCLIWSKRKVPR